MSCGGALLNGRRMSWVGRRQQKYGAARLKYHVHVPFVVGVGGCV